MSESMQSALKQNLVWIVGLVVCIVVAIGAGLNSMRSSGDDTAAQSQREKKLVTGSVDERYLRPLFEPPPPPKTVQEETEEIIEEYREVIEDENIPLEERVRYLYATGNLKLNNLGDVEGARQIFEQIILEYPDHFRASRSYLRLHECYRRLGDEENMRWVCLQILDRYKPGDAVYIWAEKELGMQVTEVEDEDEDADEPSLLEVNPS